LQQSDFGRSFDDWAESPALTSFSAAPYNGSAVLGLIRDKLARTREALRGRLGDLFKSGRPREEVLDELAEILILADVGPAATDKILDALRKKTKKTDPADALSGLLKEELTAILSKHPPRLAVDSTPAVVMVVGVNGGGKTTSVAKLAARFTSEGKTVMLVAADTFRAAAQEQLVLWGKKLRCPVIRGGYGADPSSVVFDALQSFKAQKLDVLVGDTAGRVHTNANLMAELEKIKRVIGREIPGAPQEILLVLDSTTGQNALFQAKEFLKVSGITGVFLTKLDGTAKGGCALAVAEELDLPIKLVGVGEGKDDWLEFSAADFVDSLVS
jgi:fused signal recognition particle receptor